MKFLSLTNSIDTNPHPHLPSHVLAREVFVSFLMITDQFHYSWESRENGSPAIFFTDITLRLYSYDKQSQDKRLYHVIYAEVFFKGQNVVNPFL